MMMMRRNGSADVVVADEVEGDDANVDGDSRAKLQAAAADLAPWISSSSSSLRLFPFPCQSSDNGGDDGEATLAYRCRCSFQIVVASDGSYQYAVRRAKQPPAILPEPVFAIANRRIQRAMRQLWQILNDEDQEEPSPPATTPTTNDDSSASITTATATTTTALRHNLTSVTFSTSWNEQDCVLTMNYHPCIPDQAQWQVQARRACRAMNLLQVTGRARKTLLRAHDDDDDDDKTAGNETSVVLCDTLVLKNSHNNVTGNNRASSWTVDLLTTDQAATDTTNSTITMIGSDGGGDDDDIRSDGDDCKTTTRQSTPATTTCDTIQVHYRKPEGAFFHPNPRVMIQSLEWILNRLQQVVAVSVAADNNLSSLPVVVEQQQRQRLGLFLLELYCGCGAHTMALAKSKLFPKIMALELDERLVKALKRNCELNHIPVKAVSSSSSPVSVCREQDLVEGGDACRVEVVAEDAGKWVRRQQHRPRRRHCELLAGGGSCGDGCCCSLLRPLEAVVLVDPPKQGLDERVCQFLLHDEDDIHYYNNTDTYLQKGDTDCASSRASSISVSDVLYVSCGPEALQRDLALLAKSFEVVDCVLLDLFPGTSAVETLVHLQRRKRQN